MVKINIETYKLDLRYSRIWFISVEPFHPKTFMYNLLASKMPCEYLITVYMKEIILCYMILAQSWNLKIVGIQGFSWSVIHKCFSVTSRNNFCSATNSNIYKGHQFRTEKFRNFEQNLSEVAVVLYFCLIFVSGITGARTRFFWLELSHDSYNSLPFPIVTYWESIFNISSTDRIFFTIFVSCIFVNSAIKLFKYFLINSD